jgi:hypothetical protein
MKQIVNNKPNEVIDISRVVFESSKPIGVVFNRRDKSLVIKSTHGGREVYRFRFIDLLNRQHPVTSTGEADNLTELLKFLLDAGNYEIFQFDSWKEFYLWCAE